MSESEGQVADSLRQMLIEDLAEATMDDHQCCNDVGEPGIEAHRYDASVHVDSLIKRPHMIRVLLSLAMRAMAVEHDG